MFIEPKTVVWIAGASGRLGRAIEHTLDHSRYMIIPTDTDVDITDLATVAEHAETYRPEVIINCAAMARKADAEANPDAAYKINALGARNLAIAATSAGATLVHLSTDDLFPGVIAHKINEFDKTLPPHVYGKSKEAGERLVRELCTRHIIVRSSWVYTANEDDLIFRMLNACKRGETVEIPTNQYASPTSVDTLAKFIVAALECDEFGTFHAADKGLCSRFEFAKHVCDLAGVPTTTLVGRQDPAEAYRIELDNLMMRLTGVFEMPTWQDDVKDYLGAHGLLVE